MPFWFAKNQKIFNSLHSKIKVTNLPLIIASIAFGASFLLTLIRFALAIFDPSPLPEILDLYDAVVQICGTVAILVTAFQARTILKDHYKINISILFTILFSYVYFQFKINQLLENN